MGSPLYPANFMMNIPALQAFIMGDRYKQTSHCDTE